MYGGLNGSRIAIWNRHPAVVALSVAGILVQVAFLVYSVTIATDTWGADSPSVQGCLKVNIVQTSLPALAATFAIDALLLLLMLVGLFVRREACRFGLGGLLLRQGLIWLALATAAELPTIVCRSNLRAMSSMYADDIIDNPQPQSEWCVRDDVIPFRTLISTDLQKRCIKYVLVYPRRLDLELMRLLSSS